LPYKNIEPTNFLSQFLQFRFELDFLLGKRNGRKHGKSDRFKRWRLLGEQSHDTVHILSCLLGQLTALGPQRITVAVNIYIDLLDHGMFLQVPWTSQLHLDFLQNKHKLLFYPQFLGIGKTGFRPRKGCRTGLRKLA